MALLALACSGPLEKPGHPLRGRDAGEEPNAATLDERLAAARARIPPYLGSERDHLSSDEAQRVNVAIERLQSIVREASGRYLADRRVLYDLVHAWVLVGVDRGYRGDCDGMRTAFEHVEDLVCETARLGLVDSWMHYKHGIALQALGVPDQAPRCFGIAIEVAGNRLEESDVRGRARLERAAALVRAGDYELAKREGGALLAESGNDHLREGTLRTLAHVDILGGDRAAASRHLREAIGMAVDWTYSIEPLMLAYACSDDIVERNRCILEMLDLVEHAPRDPFELRWQWTLLSFLLAEHAKGGLHAQLPQADKDRLLAAGWSAERPESFENCIAAEERLRNGGQWPIGALRSSGWLQIGVVLENEAARAANSTQREALLDRARRAYAQSSSQQACASGWDRMHARVRGERLDDKR